MRNPLRFSRQSLLAGSLFLSLVGCQKGGGESTQSAGADSPQSTEAEAAKKDSGKTLSHEPVGQETGKISNTNNKAKGARLELRNSGLGGVDASTEPSEEAIKALFPDWEVDWRREKGRASAYILASNSEGHKIEFVQTPGDSKKLGYIAVIRPGIPAPSGLGVGSSFRALSELVDELHCQGHPERPTQNNVIYRAYTECVAPRFPKVSYIFRRRVFGMEGPDPKEDVRIDELRWAP